MWRPFDGVSFSQELFEKDLTEPTDEEDQAYKPAEPISEAHCGHRTEYATALSHDFFLASLLAKSKSRLRCLIKDLAFAGPQGGRGSIQGVQSSFVQHWSILMPTK
jgi:hypothetical protein